MTDGSLAFAPISKRSLAETVYDRLLESIITGDLAVGSRLNLDEISAGFGVSKTPVREALARLEQEQFVEVSRSSATTVAPWTVADMKVRARLLASIARIATNDPTVLIGSLPDPRASGPDVFVVVCQTFAMTLTSSLARQTAATVAAPLSLFLQPSVLQGHGIDVAAMRLEPEVAFLAEALDGGDRQVIALAVDDLADAFIHGLGPNDP